MNTQIIPYYLRYTEFSPLDRLMLEHLAAARLEFRDQYTLAKIAQGRLGLNPYDRKKALVIQQTCDMFREAIGQIDEAILCMYMAYGRVN